MQPARFRFTRHFHGKHGKSKMHQKGVSLEHPLIGCEVRISLEMLELQSRDQISLSIVLRVPHLTVAPLNDRGGAAVNE
jgi:hypothetical protein